MSGRDQQVHEHQELEERTVTALVHARDLGLSQDDLSLLCWHSGVDSKLIQEVNNEIQR
jgi:hypothetical protein